MMYQNLKLMMLAIYLFAATSNAHTITFADSDVVIKTSRSTSEEKDDSISFEVLGDKKLASEVPSRSYHITWLSSFINISKNFESEDLKNEFLVMFGTSFQSKYTPDVFITNLLKTLSLFNESETWHPF
jgi:hypothetical protein